MHYLENLELTSFFFYENSTLFFNFLIFQDFFFLFNWNESSQFIFNNFNFLLNSNNLNLYYKEFENLSNFSNLENLFTLYHYSIPTTKLAYPEPFIASASFMHSDLWFVHILIYQYWLWFVFTFIIIFFFITFVCTVRWCNLRVRPRRETRGVSRSKCGDLITACVPVSWATSIIISESTDAIDYFDGFGTTELVVGIRAYQWGWEYYYPKDIDLNYNIKNNYSTFIGNSLKYVPANPINLKNNNLWKFYQNKQTDHIITPAYLFLFSLDNFKIFNYFNFNDIGLNVLNESNVFKKIKIFSKFLPDFYDFSYNNFKNNYNFLKSIYFKNNLFFSSISFGSKKQQNFLVNQNSFSSLYPNLKSVDKLFNFIFSYNIKKNTQNFLNLNYVLENFYFNKNILNFKNSLIFNNKFLFFNNNSDKKFLNNIFLKYNFISKNKNLSNQIFFNSHHLFNYNTFNKKNFYFNKNLNSRITENFSSNQYIPTNSKFIKKFINKSLLKSNFNINNHLNLLEETNFYYNRINSSFLNLYNNLKIKKINFFLLNKIGANKIYLDSPHSPIVSNNIFYNSLNYDNCKNTNIPFIPTMFQNKEDLFPTYVYTTYWNFYWLHTSVNLKFKNYFNFINYTRKPYLPFFNLNYDYDFKNWQTYELLEDNIWESFFNSYYFDEYKFLNFFFYNNSEFDKISNFFIFLDKFFVNDNNEISYDYIFDNEYFFLPISDDYFVKLSNLNLNNYFIFPVINTLNFIDESYESLKTFNFLFKFKNKTFINFSSNLYFAISQLQHFNFFRSNFDEFSWYKTNSDFYKYIYNNENNLIFFDNNYSQNFRFTNFYNVRNTLKSSIVNFNALQKVFKTRLDENRSNAKLDDINKIYLENTKQPFITTSRPHYERLIGKNHQNFFKLNFFKPSFNKLLSENNNIFNSLNFYFFDFPFLLAYKSDSSRYMWIDWFAKWGFYEVQPSSSSKYSLHGMPYFNKFFEFNYEQNEILNETETYFIRISKARKNYLNNWNYTPFFFLKNNFWSSSFFFKNTTNKLVNLNFQLNSIEFYWNLNMKKFNIFFLYSNSNINSFAKTLWRSNSSISSYFLTFQNLNDIFSKKEYLYKKLLFKSNKLIHLPNNLINSPNNALLKEIKNLFNYVDPINICNDYSKINHFNTLEYFNYFNLFYFYDYSNFFNFNFLYKKLFSYFFYNSQFKKNDILLKNTHRPLKKGINNMIRLHGTGAVAMPIEIRLQVLASSKDVIHSWAIPSAGIKIDCVPGYSSHKVMIFLVSGIFWGQCMEICGRYHHWMPIIVYFMKRDLFFLWCTHFVFLSGSNNIWTINDRQFTDYTKLVSYDKSSWLKEIIK